jgi:hypothetical protein
MRVLARKSAPVLARWMDSSSSALAADHAAHGSGRGRELPHQPRVVEHLESAREQRVAGQNRHRLAELLVAGGTAAAEIVVIERGQVVVDE